MLRAVRFATTYELQIEPATLAAIQAMADEVTQVSAERIGAELARMLAHPRRALGVRLLHESGLLPPLLPELSAAAAADASAWQNALRILEKLESGNFATAVAALLHEVCRPREVGAVCHRFRWSNKETDLARWLVTQLPRVRTADELPWPELQRVLVHDDAAELLALATAVLGADHPGVRLCTAKLALPPAQLNPPLLLTGDDLVRRGLEPGPHFARLLTAVRDAQLEGQIHDQAGAWSVVEALSRD